MTTMLYGPWISNAAFEKALTGTQKELRAICKSNGVSQFPTDKSSMCERLRLFRTTGYKGPGSYRGGRPADTAAPEVEYRRGWDVGIGEEGTGPALLAHVFELTIAPPTVTHEEVGLTPADKRSRETPFVAKNATRKPPGSRLQQDYDDEPF